MSENGAGSYLLGWLGRQFGYVKKAINTDVTKSVIHRQKRVEEATLPEHPQLKLRRTIIDEVIVDKTPVTKEPESGTQPPRPGDDPA